MVENLNEHDSCNVRTQPGINVPASLDSIVKRLEKLECEKGNGQERSKRGWVSQEYGRGTWAKKCFKCGQEGHFTTGYAFDPGHHAGHVLGVVNVYVTGVVTGVLVNVTGVVTGVL